MSLIKTSNNKPCFVTINTSIWSILDFKQPFAANDISMRWWGNQWPSLIFLKSFEFNFHSMQLVWICESLLDSSRFGNGTSKKCIFLYNTNFRPSYHGVAVEVWRRSCRAMYGWLEKSNLNNRRNGSIRHIHRWWEGLNYTCISIRRGGLKWGCCSGKIGGNGNSQGDHLLEWR